MKNKNQIYLLSGVVAVALLAVGVMTYSGVGGQNTQVITRPAAQAAGWKNEQREAVSPPGLGNRCPEGDKCVFLGPHDTVKIANFEQIASTGTTLPGGTTTGGRSVGGLEATRGTYIAHQDRPQVLGHDVEFVGNTTTDIGPTSATSADLPDLNTGNNVLFKHFQDPASAATGGAAATALVNSDQDIVAVVGGTNSATAAGTKSWLNNPNPLLTFAVPNTTATKVTGANEVFSNLKMPQVSPVILAPSLTDFCPPTSPLANADTTCRSDFFARTSPSQALQGIKMAEYAYSLGYRKAATIHDNRVNNAENAIAFQKRFVALGTPTDPTTITRKESVTSASTGATPSPSTTNFVPLLTCIIATGSPVSPCTDTVGPGGVPDIIYASVTFPAPSAKLFKDARTIAALNVTRLSGYNTLRVSDLLTGAGADSLGVLTTIVDVSTFTQPAFDALKTKHQSLFGAPLAEFQYANGYDAYNLVLDAIANVAFPADIDAPDTASQGWIVIPMGALKDELLKNQTTMGISAPLNCANPGSNVGDCAPAVMQIEEVQTCDVEAGDTDPCVGGLEFDKVS